MPAEKRNGELKALQALYEDEENYAKVVLDDFAGRTNRQSITGVDQIVSRLRGSAELPKWAVVKLFKALGELGYGRFVVGRRGGESRFIWTANPIEVGKAARGEVAAISSLPEPETSDIEMVNHQFKLRPTMSITIELPADFTEKEAERFAQFLRSLPFVEE